MYHISYPPSQGCPRIKVQVPHGLLHLKTSNILKHTNLFYFLHKSISTFHHPYISPLTNHKKCNETHTHIAMYYSQILQLNTYKYCKPPPTHIAITNYHPHILQSPITTHAYCNLTPKIIAIHHPHILQLTNQTYWHSILQFTTHKILTIQT